MDGLRFQLRCWFRGFQRSGPCPLAATPCETQPVGLHAPPSAQMSTPTCVQVSASRLESCILNALVQNSRQLVSQPPACSSTSWKLLTDTENDTGLKSRICFKLLNPKLLNPKPSNKPLRPEIRLSSQLLGICPFFTMGACGGFATSPPGSWGSCAIVRFWLHES